MSTRLESPSMSRLRVWCAASVLLVCASALSAQTPTPSPSRATAPVPSTAPATSPASASAVARGFVVGQVIEKESGRPMELVNVFLVGTTFRGQTDLDGRFRIAASVGVYSVRAMRLGSAPAQIDSVRVTAGGTTTSNFALGSVAVSLGGVTVTAGPVKATSEDALLAMQKVAPRVSDGISAEAIRRAPGNDASDAIVRVTGVSVVDNKFAVVRGLAERYSNTLLNGVELPSPEPLKKIVPLDLFPSSLLQSIVVSKTATPDRPGDFAGGSVEVSTMEFPDTPVREFRLSTGYNSQSTLRSVARLPQRGTDWVGFDDGGGRAFPTARVPGQGIYLESGERFAEQLRNEWTPTAKPVLPDLGAGVNFGGRFGGDAAPFGYVISGTYARGTDATSNRLAQLVFDADQGVPDQGYVSDESTQSVDLGFIANFAARIGATQKLGLKNLYTRNAEELYARSLGFETVSGAAERLTYQVRYITRELMQTQLTGEHLIPFLADSRIEWKTTLAVAARDEPENRSLVYLRPAGQPAFVLSPSVPSPFWFRFLDDRVRSAQVDWSVPLSRFLPDGAQLKVGGLYRERDRQFDAYYFRVWLDAPPEQLGIASLPPDQVFSPELIGSGIDLRNDGAGSLPYESDDDVRAHYAMLDLPVFSWLRVVGGLRHEDWKLNLYQGTRLVPTGDPTKQRKGDDLWSSNVTLSLTDRQNIRLAAYKTVTRPDPREVAPDYYVAITGDCANRGFPGLRAGTVINADVRWEFFPRAGELFSVSAFHKDFSDPIAEYVSFQGSSLCTVEYSNLESGRITGGELEIRRALDFLPGPLGRMAIGLNLTMVESETSYRINPTLVRTLTMQGQSKALVNLNLLYQEPTTGFDASLLINYFSDRIARYGVSSTNGNGELDEVPNLTEQGRVSVDAKLSRKFGATSVSLSARNLSDNEVIFYQESNAGRIRTGYLRPGVSVSLGVGYAIR